jgi:hypothetical protein
MVGKGVLSPGVCTQICAELIRIEATLEVASILCSRKPGMPLSVSSRVLRPGRGCVMRLNYGEAHDMGAAKEHRAASAGRWQAVAFPSAAALYSLMAGCGRTGARGVPHRVALRASGQRHASQPVSTKSLGEVQRRMMTRSGAPQVGQRAACDGRGVRSGSCASPGCPCTSMRRMVASGMAQLA